MILRDKNRRTLFVLGAGATRGALSGTRSPRVNPPLNADFFDEVLKFSRVPEAKPIRSAIQRLEEFRTREIGRKGVKSFTMEEVFNVLLLSKDMPQVFRRGRGRTRHSGYRREVRDFLSVLIRLFRFVQSRCRHRDGLDHYAMLARALRPGDRVMTLNYDTLMDNALIHNGWNPQSGYGFNAKIRWDIRRPDRNGRLRDVLLLKPHGSFNWYARGRFELLEDLLARRPVSQIVVSLLPKAYETARSKLVRFFIPPMYSKFFANKFWAKLWTRSYSAVRNCDQLVIVGCSLIASDFHLRAVISKAMADRRRKYNRIVIVDPSKKVQAELKSFFRGRSHTGITVYPTFSDFCRGTLE